MDIIKNWLTLKLGLQVPCVDDFEKGLANGVLIAEILRKYGVLSDDEEISLKHDNTQKTKLGNIKHLEQWLSGSGLKIKASDLEDIAKEKKGVGVKLLYELFLRFEFGPRASNLSGDAQPTFLVGNGTGVEAEKWAFLPGKTAVSGAKQCDDQRRGTGQQSYTTDERIEYPRRVVLQKPFLESSEAAQVQHLYFCLKTLQVLKKQNEERLQLDRDRHARIREGQLDCKEWIGENFLAKIENYKLDSASIANRQEQKIELVKTTKLRKVLDDMDKFDLISAQADSRCDSDLPIYADGRGDSCQYELKMNEMKYIRQLKREREEKRSLLRLQILKRFTQKTPMKMLKSLENDAVSRLTALPASERLLASYLYRCNDEKEHFFNHSGYAAQQLQEAMMLDLNKKTRITAEDECFRKFAAAEMANSHKTFDFVCRVLEEPDLIKKLAMADETIKEMLQRAMKIKPSPPPPPPPCTPTFTHRKRCKEIMDPNFGKILVCEDETVGESGGPEITYCRIVRREFGEGEE